MKLQSPLAGPRGARVQALLALAATCFPVAVQAVTWDNSVGDGDWSTAGNWDGDVEPTLATPVIFPVSPTGGINLGFGELAASLQFDASYTLTGGALTLPTGNSINVASGVTAHINTPLTVSTSLTKTGTGTLALYGSNTIPATTIQSGKISLRSAAALGGATSVTTVNGGSTLEVANAITFASPITLMDGATLSASAFSNASGAITIDPAATAITLAAPNSVDTLVLAGGGAFNGGSASTAVTISGGGGGSGSGKVRIASLNTFDGSWLVPAGGMLELGSATALGDNPGASITLSGGTLSARPNAPTSFTTSQANNIILTASSSLLSDRSTIVPTSHIFGALSMGSHTLTVAPGATATNSGTAGIVLGEVGLSGDPTFAVNDNNAVNGKLSIGTLSGGGVARAIVKTGDGDLSLANSDLLAGSTYTASGSGITELLYPNLGAAEIVNVTTAQNPLRSCPLNLTDGGLRFMADGSGNTSTQTYVLPLSITLAGNVTLDADRRSISNANKTFELPGLSVAAGSVLDISGANAHGLRLSGGLALQGSATLQGTSMFNKTGSLVLNAGILGSGSTQLSIGGGASPMSLMLNAASTYGGGTLMSGSTVTLNAANALGTGPLTLSGGTLIVNVDDALNGSIAINGGTLRVNDIDAIDGNAVNLNGGTLDLRSNATATVLTGALTVSGISTLGLGNNGSGIAQTLTLPALKVSGTTALTVNPLNSYDARINTLTLAGDLTLTQNSIRTTYIQTLAETGGPRLFIKAGIGTVALEGASTRSGGTEVVAGKLLVTHASALGSGTLTIGAPGGSELAVASFSGILSIPNNIVVRAGSTGTATLDAATNGVNWHGTLNLQKNLRLDATSGLSNYHGVISGPGNLSKSGDDIELKNAANSFGNGSPDSVLVASGFLNVASDGALGDPANGVTINLNADLRVKGSFSSARTFTFLNISGGIEVNPSQELTLNGALAGPGAFEKTGQGIVTMAPAADSTARGAVETRVRAGTLRLQGLNGLSNAGPINLSGSSAKLELLRDANSAFAYPITSTGIGSILVDRASGGSGTNGRHSLGALSMTSGSLTVNGANGYGLSFGPTTVSSDSFLTNNASVPLILASLLSNSSSGSSSAMSFGGTGDIQVAGATSQTATTGAYGLQKTGSGTLRLGTSMAGFNGLTIVTDGTLDLNGLTHTAASVNMGGFASAGGARIVTGPGGLLQITGTGLIFSSNVNPAGASITGAVGLGAAPRTFTVGDSTGAALDLLIDGPITGNLGAGFQKSGPGTMRLSGAGNTQPGLVTNTAGALELAKSSGDAIGTGGLSITGGVVSLLASDQIKDTAAVTVNSSSTAYLDLASHTDTTGNITLTQSSATGSSAIKTGASGTLVLNGNLTFNNNTNTADTNARNVLITGSGTLATPSSTGTLDLGGVTRTIHCATTTVGANETKANATIETRIINGGIIKTGARTLYLTNPNNTFAGGIQVNQGTIRPTVSGALGSGPVTFANGAGVSAGLDLSDAASPLAGDFVIGGAGDFELTYAGAIPSTLQMTGNFTLQKDLKVNVVNGTTGDQQTATLHLSGAISDGASTFGLIKKGNGVLRLAAGNAYSGATTILDGVLRIAGESSLGDSTLALMIDGGALGFDAGNTTPVIRDIDMGPNGGGIRGEPGSDKTLSGNIDWGIAPADAVYGHGVVVLSGTTSGGYSTDLQLGRPLAFAPLPTDLAEEGQGVVLSLRGAAELPGGSLRIENAAVLELGNGDFTRAIGTGDGQFTIAERDGGGWAARGVDRHINLGGAAQQVVWGSTGFLREVDASSVVWPAPLILGSSTATHTLNFDNPIDLNPAFSDVDHVSSRSIRVHDGSADIDARISGDISYLDNTAPITPVGLSVSGGGSIEFAGDLLGRIEFSQDSPATIIFSGDNDLQDGMSISAGTWIFAHDESVGAPSELFCTDDGVIDATALTGPYAIQAAGEMFVDGTILGSVLAPADFSGNGSISGSLLTSSTSRIFPNYDGTLDVGGDFDHVAGAWLDFEISGLEPEEEYNRMRVGGEVKLAGNVFVSDFFDLELGQSFVFILNDGTDPITGQFNALPEGALRHLGNGLALQFTYQANGDGGAVGNDFGATVVTSPAATDRQLSGTGPLAVAPGEEIVLHYVLGTAGPGSEDHPFLSVGFPAGLSFTGSTPAADHVTSSSLQVTLPPQAAGSTTNVELHFTAPLAAPGSVRVNATYNGNAPELDDVSPSATLVTAILPGGQLPPLMSVLRSPVDGDLEASIATLQDVHYLFEGSLELEDWYPIESFYGTGSPVTIETPVDEKNEYFRFRIIPWEEEVIGAE